MRISSGPGRGVGNGGDADEEICKQTIQLEGGSMDLRAKGFSL